MSECMSHSFCPNHFSNLSLTGQSHSFLWYNYHRLIKLKYTFLGQNHLYPMTYWTSSFKCLAVTSNSTHNQKINHHYIIWPYFCSSFFNIPNLGGFTNNIYLVSSRFILHSLLFAPPPFNHPLSPTNSIPWISLESSSPTFRPSPLLSCNSSLPFSPGLFWSPKITWKITLKSPLGVHSSRLSFLNPPTQHQDLRDHSFNALCCSYKRFSKWTNQSSLPWNSLLFYASGFTYPFLNQQPNPHSCLPSKFLTQSLKPQLDVPPSGNLLYPPNPTDTPSHFCYLAILLFLYLSSNIVIYFIITPSCPSRLSSSRNCF